MEERTIKEVKDQLKGYYKAHKILHKENRQLQSLIQHVSSLCCETITQMENEMIENLKKMELIEKGIEICKAEQKFLEEVEEVDRCENDKFTQDWYNRIVDKCMEEEEAEAIIQVGKSFYHVPDTDFEIDLIDITRRENK